MQKVNTSFSGSVIHFVYDGVYHTVTLETGYRGFNIPVSLSRKSPNDVWSVLVKGGHTPKVLFCTETNIERS